MLLVIMLTLKKGTVQDWSLVEIWLEGCCLEESRTDFRDTPYNCLVKEDLKALMAVKV